MNPYKAILEDVIPRLVNMICLDTSSDKYGYADRQHWAWKTIDFTNGTYQGICHSLAIAVKMEIIDSEKGCELIDALLRAIPKIRRSNGSMEEAFPNENSFCVTALVAFDALSAVYRLGENISEVKRAEYLEFVRPLIGFLRDNDETHAIISNHLATGVAAVYLWNMLAKEQLSRGDELLQIILNHQSTEGWYLEYEGPDPGYQTLCTYYLSAALEVNPTPELKDSIDRSISFLSNFVMPDGSVGGIFGSRNTEVYYPGGITFLAASHAAARSIEFRRLNAAKKSEVLPSSIDRENLIPLSNAYAFAAYHFQEPDLSVNLETKSPHDYTEAGLFVKETEAYRIIINYKKGGVFRLYHVETGEAQEDTGVQISRSSDRLTSQMYDPDITFQGYELSADFYQLKEEHPSPFQFVIIRMLGLTLFRIKTIRELFKRLLVKRLMTGKKRISGVRLIRKFRFEKQQVHVEDRLIGVDDSWKVRNDEHRAIHMASSGYNPKFLSGGTNTELVNYKLIRE